VEETRVLERVISMAEELLKQGGKLASGASAVAREAGLK
jgi:hypothetical protein